MLVIGSRAFFSPAPCKDGPRTRCWRRLAQLGIDAVTLPFEATANGAVQSIADAELYAAHFKAHADRIDGLVICLPNFGDEIAIAELVNRARLNVPILLQASNDEVDKVDVHSRRDAFCGKISVTNNFWQYGVPFTETTTHTCDICGRRSSARDLDRFARICRTVRGLRGARLGVHRRAHRRVPDHALFRKAAAGRGHHRGDRRPVRDDRRRRGHRGRRPRPAGDAGKDQGLWPDPGPYPAKPDRSSRPSGPSPSTAGSRRTTATPSPSSAGGRLQDNFGCATCLTMSMMGEELMPSACEVDIMGALSMYALALASGAPPAILDWNNNYGHEADLCVCTHCGNYPKSFIGDTPEIRELDVLGESIGRVEMLRRGQGQGQARPDDLFPPVHRRPRRHAQVLSGRGRVHRPSLRHGRRHRRHPGRAAARADALSSPRTASNTTSPWCAAITPMS